MMIANEKIGRSAKKAAQRGPKHVKNALKSLLKMKSPKWKFPFASRLLHIILILPSSRNNIFKTSSQFFCYFNAQDSHWFHNVKDVIMISLTIHNEHDLT